MYKILAFVTLATGICLPALASDPTVTITSFKYADSKGRAAELCGKIEGATSYPVVVKVVVDPKGKLPGNYSVTALGETFCTAVVTYTGDAEASIWK